MNVAASWETTSQQQLHIMGRGTQFWRKLLSFFTIAHPRPSFSSSQLIPKGDHPNIHWETFQVEVRNIQAKHNLSHQVKCGPSWSYKLFNKLASTNLTCILIFSVSISLFSLSLNPLSFPLYLPSPSLLTTPPLPPTPSLTSSLPPSPSSLPPSFLRDNREAGIEKM